ncbi:5'/3'-nucleotidase SurE [bacterium]|nr:5'/3'-nucleotidase SurE [bacterium]
MVLLISNDDGIEARGIHALAEAVKDFGRVVVVAPHRERSTAGHSLTLHKPLRLKKIAEDVYSASGSPADCIYLGIREVLGAQPDFILSGINAGANLGTDVHYSGTVAAAREGALMNIPSYAFSLVQSAHEHSKQPASKLDYESAARAARRVFESTHQLKFPPHCLLNVNIPNRPHAENLPIQVARQGMRYYTNEVIKRQDPRGKDYYWIGGAYAGFQHAALSDCNAVEAGNIAIAPITIDCTHNDFYATLKDQPL